MNATFEQRLISKPRTPSPQQVAVVDDFVEFMAAKSKRRAAIERLLAIAPALDAAGVAPMGDDGIAAEVKAARAERRALEAATASASKRLALIGITAREVLADYVEAIELVEPTSVPRVVPSDADDDHVIVIAAAVVASAALTVSGDSDLLTMGRHLGIEIVSAALAVARIGAGVDPAAVSPQRLR